MPVFRIAPLCLMLALATGAHAASERFVINAQYRGIVSKNFPDIGSATVESVETTPGVMRVKASGEASHPQDAKRRYSTAMDLQVSVTGDSVAVRSNSESAGAGSESFCARLRQVVPILALLRAQPESACASRTLQLPGGAVRLSSKRAGSNVELTAHHGTQVVGKFFMSRGDAGLKVDRFRVPTTEANVSLNFVIQGAAPSERSTD